MVSKSSPWCVGCPDPAPVQVVLPGRCWCSGDLLPCQSHHGPQRWVGRGIVPTDLRVQLGLSDLDQRTFTFSLVPQLLPARQTDFLTVLKVKKNLLGGKCWKFIVIYAHVFPVTSLRLPLIMRTVSSV